jgi:hypothetical protein
MKTTIKTKWGSRIQIDGDIEEVKEAITSFQRREAMLHERNYENGIRFAHPISSGLKDELNILLNEGFFNTPKTLADIRLELEKRGKAFPNTSIHPTLQLMTNEGKLVKSLEEERNVFAYKKNEEKEK